MSDRSYLIYSNKFSLSELAEAALSITRKSGLYDLLPCKIEFVNNFEWENRQITKGCSYLMLRGENGCIHNFISDLPSEMRPTIGGYNTLDMETAGLWDGSYVEEHKYPEEKFVEAIKEDNIVDAEIKDTQLDQLENILKEQGKDKEVQQVSILLEQLQEMQKNYNSMFQELKIVRNQLEQLQEPQKGTQSVIVNQMAAFEGSVQNQYKQFQDMRKQMNAKAGTLIQKFKEIGIKALNNVCRFLGIKENLIQMRDAARSNAAEMQKAVEKIDSIGTEVKNASVHLKNIGRAAVGKELIDPASREQLKIFRSIKAHYEKNLDVFQKRSEKLNESIKKFDKLEKAADRISVREKLANHKKAVEEKNTSEPKIEKDKQHQLDAAR